MPELKLIYRFLRQVSDWTVAGYYSDVYIEGEENVPKDGPLIIASTHHNEMIDIATLAATIPHRRHLSFWAKSTMFANPIAAEIMSSTGAIPVKRNLNAGGNASGNASISPSKSFNTDASGFTTVPNTHTNTHTHNVNTVPNPSSHLKTPPTAPIPLSRTSLFSTTSHTLANGGVIGVFPEGTSYTQARIVQVMSGAGWAGVEYLKFWREREQRKGVAGGGSRGTGLKIIPVAVVYTDKARYRSKIVVRYGAPILMDDYVDELFGEARGGENAGSSGDVDVDERSKEVVKKVTKRVEEALVGMTINASDWDTICATSMARTILWGSEEGVPLKHWVDVSQRLVKELELSPIPERSHLHRALSKYYALLHHTKTKHSILTSLVPLSSSSTPSSPALILKSTVSLLTYTLPTLPLTLLFVPSFILFLPGYISGSLANRFLAVRGEEESPAQFKAIVGGMGVGVGIGIGATVAKLNSGPLRGVVSGLLKSVVDNVKELSSSWAGELISNVMGRFKGTGVEKMGVLGFQSLIQFLEKVERTSGKAGKCGAVLVALWANVYFLSRWHSSLVDVNYRMLRRLITYTKLISAFTSSSSTNTNSIIEKYSLPPLPALNPYIKRSLAASSSSSPTPSPFNSTTLSPSTSTSLSNSLSSSTSSITTTSSTTTLPSLPAAPTPLPTTLSSSSSLSSRPTPRTPTSGEQKVLMRQLLVARKEACLALKNHFQLDGRHNGTKDWVELRRAGAKVPGV